MRGSELKRLIDERGLKYRHVAERMGKKSLSKIWKKTNISTDELERVARAMNLKPGDLLENSCGELKELLPLIESLRKFDSSSLPHVMVALEAMRAMRENGRRE